MKKVLIIAACTVAALFVIHACTRESNDNPRVSPTGDEAAFEQLNVLIDNYNRSFFAKYDLVSTRSDDVTNYDPTNPTVDCKKGWFRRFLTVFLDAIGGLIGGSTGIILGADAGYANASYLGGLFSSAIKPRLNDLGIHPDFTTITNYYNNLHNTSVYDNVGLVHNELLVRLNNKYTEEVLNKASLEEMYYMMLEETRELGFTMKKPMLSVKEFESLFTSVSQALLSGDLNKVTSAVTNFYPNLENEVNTFITFISNYYNIDDDTNGINYAEGFRNVIMESAIPSASKNSLQAGISTAIGSNSLWHENK